MAVAPKVHKIYTPDLVQNDRDNVHNIFIHIFRWGWDTDGDDGRLSLITVTYKLQRVTYNLHVGHFSATLLFMHGFRGAALNQWRQCVPAGAMYVTMFNYLL